MASCGINDVTFQSEENMDLQRRSAVAVASFISFCASNGLAQPPEKIVKNLCTFLCQDVEQTPTFAYNRQIEGGILSFKTIMRGEGAGANGKGRGNADPTQSDDAEKAKLSRRGAEFAFTELSSRFGERLFEVVPKMWEFMAGGLLAAFAKGW